MMITNKEGTVKTEFRGEHVVAYTTYSDFNEKHIMIPKVVDVFLAAGHKVSFNSHDYNDEDLIRLVSSLMKALW